MKQKHRLLGYVGLGVVLLLGVLVWRFLPMFTAYVNPVMLRGLMLESGVRGYIWYLVIMMLSVPLPIPSTTVVLASGYVYGTGVGVVLSLIGIVFGATFTFYLFRFFGKFILEKMVDEHHVRHFTHLFKRRGIPFVLLSFLLPIFPDDVVIMLLGMTSMSYPIFLLLLIIGHIPRFLLVNAVGEDLYTGLTLRTVLLLVLCGVLMLMAIYREKVKRVFFHELRGLEGEVEVVERKAGIVKHNARRNGEIMRSRKRRGKIERG